MNKVLFLFNVFIGLCCHSCKYSTTNNLSKTQESAILQEINTAADSIKKLSSSQKINYWKTLNQDIKTDAISAMILFNLAKSYAPINIDSAELLINQSLRLIDKEDGYFLEKMKIYNGAGNVANTKNKLYESTYYYNQAAAIVSADDKVDTNKANKANILLSAAQNNTRLKQYAKALEQNHLALTILNNDTNTYDLQHRAYSQIFQTTLLFTPSPDSLRPLISKLDMLLPYCKNVSSTRFNNDHKSMYYYLTGQYDSSIFYNHLVLSYDHNILKKKVFYEAIVNLYNTQCNLALNFINLKRIDSAKYYIDKAEELYQQHTQYFDDNTIIYLLTAKKNYHKLTGNVKATYDVSEEIASLQSSILANANIQSMEEMSALYQIRAKDQSISNLNQTVSLANEKLKRNQLLMLSSVLAALLAISFTALIYYRQKQRKLLAEKEKISLQQQLLRTQMEPHFIFNTLSSLQSFIRFDDRGKALKYISHFSKLLRGSLELSRHNTVPLQEELDAIESYLALQQMRYEDKFSYVITLQQGLDTDVISIPPMLIQPFVENSIIHGMKGIEHKMVIKIDLYINGKMLYITISDNGNGTQSSSTMDHKHKSLSGTIAKERLEILAKEHNLNANLEVNAQEGIGTTVILTLPIV